MNYPRLAPTLRTNGFFPAPLIDGRPAGAWGVGQPNYSQGNYSGAAAAVLTAVKPPRGPFPGVVLKPQETFLATLTVSVRPERIEAVDAIVARYVGAAKCPTRVDADGKVLRVFRFTGSVPCTTLSTERWPDHARIDCKDSFIPLDGEWTGSLLDTPRSELAALDQSAARALLAEINTYLSDQHPVVERKIAPLPPVAWDGRYSNERAVDRLRDNGFRPVELAKDSVGIQLAPDVVAVAVRSPKADVHALIAGRYGAGLVRVESNGTRVYLFAGSPFVIEPWSRSEFRKGVWVPGTRTSIEFQSKGTLALSGKDESNSAYWWTGVESWLDVTHESLPQLNRGAASQMLGEVERLLGVL